MAYSPESNKVETGVQNACDVLGKYLGVRVMVIRGGPNVSDPCGQIASYLAMRDRFGTGYAVKVNIEGRLQSLDKYENGVLVPGA